MRATWMETLEFSIESWSIMGLQHIVAHCPEPKIVGMAQDFLDIIYELQEKEEDNNRDFAAEAYAHLTTTNK